MSQVTHIPVSIVATAAEVPALFASAEALTAMLAPDQPVDVLRPHKLHAAAQLFSRYFAGRSLYAVKCNPQPEVLRALYAGGITRFDVASLAEVALVADTLPQAEMAYMHPVKSRSAIRTAYHAYGVRTFALDSFDELMKVLEETHNARDLTLIVRLAVGKGSAVMDLSGKFGASAEVAPQLLQQARKAAMRVGISFHVGSQTMEPDSYRQALLMAHEIVRRAGVKVDVVDVGGGFPVAYPGLVPLPLLSFFEVITSTLKSLAAFKGAELWAEPGRALVAGAGSLIVRVELRKGQNLYINDGVYGALFDAGSSSHWRYPCRKVGADERGPMLPYTFYGPTCDTHDVMRGPFLLPADVQEGDWLEIGQLGAYGGTLRTHFNGCAGPLQAVLTDDPFTS